MSHTYSEFLPSYSVGVDCYKAIPEIVILLNAANLPQDSSYKNTVLCTYDSYGKIKKGFA